MVYGFLKCLNISFVKGNLFQIVAVIDSVLMNERFDINQILNPK